MTDGSLARQRLQKMYPELFTLTEYLSANIHLYGNRVIEKTLEEWIAEDRTGELLPATIKELNAAMKHLPVTFDELSDLANYVLDSDEDARQLLFTLRDGLQAGLDARLKKNV